MTSYPRQTSSLAQSWTSLWNFLRLPTNDDIFFEIDRSNLFDSAEKDYEECIGFDLGSKPWDPLCQTRFALY